MKDMLLNKVVLMLLYFIVCNNAVANSVIKIEANHYHIDRKNHIILINQLSNDVNNTVNNVYKDQILLDGLYQIIIPNQVIDKSKEYIVKFEGINYNLYFTELPIVKINTKSTIVDAPSVFANFSLIEANGKIATYDVGIELRGSSSQQRSKKSYELSFLTDTISGDSRDVRFMGMRTDNKWNLQAIFNEPLRVRSKVSNDLWLDMHQLYYKSKEPDAKNGISMAYTEVFVNDEYKGVYALSERVDRKQLKLKKYANGIAGELYKGSYWDGPVVFSSLSNFDNKKDVWGGFEYKHPDEEVNWSNLYSFIEFVIKSDDDTFNKEYQKLFNIDNAVDYFILLNLLKASDNTGKNLYIAKYKQGEPYYYVPWDLDGVFGTNWEGNKDPYTEGILRNGFYDRLLKDRSSNGFCAKLARRWRELRSSVITVEYIISKFERENNYLAANNVYEREMRIWEEYTYDVSHLAYTRSWLQKRIAYLDKYFEQYEPVLSAANVRDKTINIYPNPVSEYLFIECEASTYELCIQDMNGSTMSTYTVRENKNKIDIRNLRKGIYIATLKSDNLLVRKKIVIN